MKTEDIKKYWATEKRDIKLDVELWDSQSDDPTYQNTYDCFLKLLEDEHMLDKNFDVLDIGCGAGAYSLALAEMVGSVTGIDLSPKMLAHGKKKATDSGVENVTFKQADWNVIDLKQLGMVERFDLAFAHNTPAICNVDTFEKFNDASRRFCAVCTPISMAEPVMQQVQKMVGSGKDRNGCDSGFAYMLDILLQKGYKPKLSYEKQVWPMSQSYDDACSYYIGRTRMSTDLSEHQVEAVNDYLKSLVHDGVITDKINTTVATIYWEKA